MKRRFNSTIYLFFFQCSFHTSKTNFKLEFRNASKMGVAGVAGGAGGSRIQLVEQSGVGAKRRS